MHLPGHLAWEFIIWASSQRWYPRLAEARCQQERKMISLSSCRTMGRSRGETSPGLLLSQIIHAGKQMEASKVQT